MIPQEKNEIFGLSVNRLEALSDGVFAIVLTLLVLLIEVPETRLDKTELLKTLGEMVHIFLAYIISFILIGIYWWRHHTIFHYIERVDKVLTRLNLLFLLWIAFIPFPTDLLLITDLHLFSLLVLLVDSINSAQGRKPKTGDVV